MSFLGLDIGTSGTKLALFDEHGKLTNGVMEEYPTYYPASGYVEQDPNDWWSAVIRGLNRLWESGASPKDIAAIGVAGQSWSAVLLDSVGTVLTRTPIWMDTRAKAICREWEERLGAKRIFDISGNPFSPTYTLPKILHWMRHEPALIDKAAHALQSNSFIVYRLTDRPTLDVSMAYGWHNFDQAKLSYDAALTKELCIPKRLLTDPVNCDAIVGHVTREAADITGLVEGTPVVAGGLDAACSTFGVGVAEEGQAQEQGGQAGGMSICLNTPKRHEKLILGAHVVPGRWLLQGGSVGGGASLKWFAENLGAANLSASTLKRDGEDVFELLSAEAKLSRPGANGLIFLPYLAGERSPVWDAEARGMYFGLRYSHTHADLVRATMEGVAYSLKHNIETAALANAHIKELRATGGCSNSHIWTQIKADVTGINMLIPESDTATTLGAAMLAMVGTGLYESHASAARAIVKITREQKAKGGCAEYEQAYEIYKALYTNTAGCMKRLSRLGV